ncbi:MAG: dTDP-4-amino-4,6-dideoxygalactose transaminase [Bdellovibrionales bacterium]|nr:dTDP-4-amino-4,6-dideoxygalactose transaminase [Bdellovibrionales bacterium]
MLEINQYPYHKISSDKMLELEYIEDVLKSGQTSGNQYQANKVSDILKKDFNFKNVLLTPSATAALEMMALLLNIGPGDEVIMPSFTFVSTANAFALRGAKVVFADIEEKTLNLCPQSLEKSITEKTKACVVIHYGGVAADLTKIQNICIKNNIILLEDAAQCIGSQYDDKFLGSFGSLACLSFHQSKNIQCGEGGALLINDNKYIDAARIIQEKGTNRFDFKSGKANKYVWQSLGSSYLMPELSAAYLRAQLTHWKPWQVERIKVWNSYYKCLKVFSDKGLCKIASLHDKVAHNAHIFWLVLPEANIKEDFIDFMNAHSVQVATHYEPLHKSKAAEKFALNYQKLNVTESIVEGLVRLPIYSQLSEDLNNIILALNKFFKELQ